MLADLQAGHQALPSAAVRPRARASACFSHPAQRSHSCICDARDAQAPFCAGAAPALRAAAGQRGSSAPLGVAAGSSDDDDDGGVRFHARVVKRHPRIGSESEESEGASDDDDGEGSDDEGSDEESDGYGYEGAAPAADDDDDGSADDGSESDGSDGDGDRPAKRARDESGAETHAAPARHALLPAQGRTPASVHAPTLGARASGGTHFATAVQPPLPPPLPLPAQAPGAAQLLFELVDAAGFPICRPFAMLHRQNQNLLVVPKGCVAQELKAAAGFSTALTIDICAPADAPAAFIVLKTVEPYFSAVAKVLAKTQWSTSTAVLTLGTPGAVTRNSSHLAAEGVASLKSPLGGVRFKVSIEKKSGATKKLDVKFEFTLRRVAAASAAAPQAAPQRPLQQAQAPPPRAQLLPPAPPTAPPPQVLSRVTQLAAIAPPRLGARALDALMAGARGDAGPFAAAPAVGRAPSLLLRPPSAAAGFAALGAAGGGRSGAALPRSGYTAAPPRLAVQMSEDSDGSEDDEAEEMDADDVAFEQVRSAA